jgi:hypothetical protein
MPTVSQESAAKVISVSPEFIGLVVLRLEHAEQDRIHLAMFWVMLGQ